MEDGYTISWFLVGMFIILAVFGCAFTNHGRMRRDLHIVRKDGEDRRKRNRGPQARYN